VSAVFGKEGEICLARGLGRSKALHLTSARSISSSSSHLLASVSFSPVSPYASRLLVLTLLASWSLRFSPAGPHLAASPLRSLLICQSSSSSHLLVSVSFSPAGCIAEGIGNIPAFKPPIHSTPDPRYVAAISPWLLAIPSG
jgi:hypothetical protein